MLPRWVVKTNVIWWYFSFVLWKACNRSMPPRSNIVIDETDWKWFKNNLKGVWNKNYSSQYYCVKKKECFIISLVLFRGRTYPIMHDNECPVQVTCGDQRDYTIKCVKHSWMLASILCVCEISHVQNQAFIFKFIYCIVMIVLLK